MPMINKGICFDILRMLANDVAPKRCKSRRPGGALRSVRRRRAKGDAHNLNARVVNVAKIYQLTSHHSNTKGSYINLYFIAFLRLPNCSKQETVGFFGRKWRQSETFLYIVYTAHCTFNMPMAFVISLCSVKHFVRLFLQSVERLAKRLAKKLAKKLKRLWGDLPKSGHLAVVVDPKKTNDKNR